MKKKTVLLSMLFLITGMSILQAQTYTKWKRVQDPATLQSNDVVVIVDLATANAMRNNPAYEGENTVSKESPASVKVTLKEELDRITSEVGDTLVWTADRTDEKYGFWIKNAEDKTRYLFNSDQNLRVGFVKSSDAWKREFELNKGLLFQQIETDEDVYTNYHVGLKVASGIAAMMGGNTWELAADTDGGEINSDIAATQMVFFKKVETTLPDPTLHFPGHDYEADKKNGTFSGPKAVVVEDGSAVISYWSDNDDIATIDPSTGIVTLKKRGTVRIYAQVEATGSYDNYLTSYVLRIDDTSDNVKGCRTNPFTVAEAIEYAKGDHSDEAADGVCYFVSGIVSSVGGAMAGMEGMEDMMEMMSGMMGEMEFDMSAMLGMFMGEQVPGTVTYAITDNGVNKDSLTVNNGYGLLLENMMAHIDETSLSVGDWVTVYGPLEYSEDNDMMSMMGGGSKEKKKTAKVSRTNYMNYHKRNLITEDIKLYYGQQKTPEELFSITDRFGGMLVTKSNAAEPSKPYTTLTPSDKEIADWQVINKTDSVLVPKKEGLISIKVKAPVLLSATDTIYMERSFTVDVRDRDLPAAGTMVGDFQLVTSTTPLAAGDKVILVATIDNKPKVLVKSSGSAGGMMAMFGGGGSNAKDVTIDGEGKIKEIPDITQILTLADAGEGKWLLQTGKTSDYQMTYLYISDTDGGGSTSMIPGMGSSGAKLKTGLLTGDGAAGDSCKVAFSFPVENDSIQIRFNFQDRKNDKEETIKAKNVIRYEKGMMSTSFGGYEPDNTKTILPRLYKLVQYAQYPVSISAALWSTIISSYDVTLPTEVKGYAVTAVTDKSIQLSDELTSLKAGEPYLLHSENAGTYTLTRSISDVEAPATNLLRISTDATGNDVYVLANGAEGPGFYLWQGGKLGAGRVYLPATNESRTFLPFGNDETTGISDIKTMRNGKSEIFFDLSGRRLSGKPAQKGFYIFNGKKIAQ